MTDVIRELFLGGGRRPLLEPVTPRRTFDDVILPPATRRALGHALTLIHKHDLIFRQWGLGERHESGVGLAFNFAGPPGTGKTICAEAIAQALDRPLFVVRYAEVESMWAGQTAKYVAAVFRTAAEQRAVLFFDEADAIAGRRFTEVRHAYERESNAVVNVLLHELERHRGVVIFATNLAANLDPAFERRIRTHILFERPGPAERAAIWRVQLHPTRTPLADDVDFEVLGAEFDATGGQIKNAVLTAAQMASAEPGPDAAKRIHQRHFRAAMEQTLASERVMRQSHYDSAVPPGAAAAADAAAALAVPPALRRWLVLGAIGLVAVAALAGAVAAILVR
jgi:SpoVK/Ycf46/Vps4 family AAA+-type ATPase